MSLRQKYNTYIKKRIWNPKIYNYEGNFKNALTNTKKLGLNNNLFEFNDIRFTQKEKEEIINTILYQIYRVDKLKVEDLSLKCFLISEMLKDFLKEKFDINSVLTTGNVYINKLQIHYEKFSTLKKRIIDPNFNEKINFHTWLTLENFDVIDVTLSSNLWIGLKMRGLEPKRGDYQKIYWVETKKIVRNGIVYNPKVIGEEYIAKINKPSTINMIIN